MKTTKTELTAADFWVGQRVWVETGDYGVGKITAIDHYSVVINGDYERTFSEIKPILRRLESKTDDENKAYYALCYEVPDPDGCDEISGEDFDSIYTAETIESALWLIDNGFDVRGWIDAGLAVDAATLE